jgi:hypothetical protein
MNWLTTFALAAMLGGGGDWQAFTPKGAGFRISVPGLPEETQQTAKSPQGTVAIRSFPLTTKDATFVAGMTEYPAANFVAGQEQSRLDQARDGALQTAKGRLRSERKITVDGRPGRELMIATETGHAIRLRLIADGPRLFQVMVIANSRFLESPDATRFLESFRLVK